MLSTDGILAAHTITVEALGPEGLLQVLEASFGEDNAAVLKRLSARLAKAGQFGIPDDDRTIMLTSFLGVDER